MNAASKNNFVIRMKVRDDKGNVVGEIEAIPFKGLRYLAHEEGLQSVRTELVQVPGENNERTGVVRATVRTRKGIFTGIGDANATNVNRRHFLLLFRPRGLRLVVHAHRGDLVDGDDHRLRATGALGLGVEAGKMRAPRRDDGSGAAWKDEARSE